uniref:Glucosidase II subunit alpha n=1 Tax=Chromera velia CCMP2878 TaxID=1169474 RepID=A0A0G4IEL2_9ALVE|eukprot:Cvel_13655.t1-p1 / transcript=Cvel_13655.t1 / gene=Cvel_13655 / organism=Chromera_velia_CCMP2878 / gene_product=Neutral alpha-glucosidase AB, putative / transcript_product=Neutral alpha-glucosidase AB, putative / location=Cvel_scaffold942:7711-16107(+) / protein_length=1078 / sequence_SO=supercontig / SO=protein_coding / is_pseudo=false
MRTSLCSRLFAFLSLIMTGVEEGEAVDRGNFKTCNDASFCRRFVKFVNFVGADPSKGLFEVEAGRVQLDSGSKSVKFKLRNKADSSGLDAQILFFEGGLMRFLVDEIPDGSLFKRFSLPLDENFIDSNLRVDSSLHETARDGSAVSFSGNLFPSGTYKLSLVFSPFRLDLQVNDVLVQSLNSRGLLNFERYRTKEAYQQDAALRSPPKKKPKAVAEEIEDAAGEGDGNVPDDAVLPTPPPPEEEEEPPSSPPPPVFDATCLADQGGVWEESWKSHHDSKPKGPAAIGIDVSFPSSAVLTGLAEHATDLNLKAYPEPYRHYNLDVFEYELDSPMALYGVIPLLLSIQRPKAGDAGSRLASGFLWSNPSESFTKVDKSHEGAQTWWTAESGRMDLWLLAGPSPSRVSQQYLEASGMAGMPPLFALGKHQCRWNYKDEADVRYVDDMFDQVQIPYDVLWLDIEHTDGKRYFTWSPSHFPTPEKMLAEIDRKGRRMVTIVDPHIKKDKGYSVHQDIEKNGWLVKKAKNEDFEGWCWPGASVYPDFLLPETRAYWASRFAYDKYKGSAKNLYTWNDMNEPSVFNGPEVTMFKDNLHLHGTTEHRDVHNLYGYYFHKATHQGHREREKMLRPFVLTRSFFIGTHRYGAIWTGDNMAEWSHLKASVPMVLQFCICGHSFIGADVGGFFKNPEEELVVRWHQLGVWYPFYRAHAHLETKRREPWLFSEEALARIRTAVVQRYLLLPYLYTLFAEYALPTLSDRRETHTWAGAPVARPLFWEFPSDEKTMGGGPAGDAVGATMMLGSSFLIRAVTSPASEGPQTLPVYLPEGPRSWYAWGQAGSGSWSLPPGLWKVPITPDAIPVFVRGGSIVPAKFRQRRATESQKFDPFTILAYADPLPSGTEEGEIASGRMYLDDYSTFKHAADGSHLDVESREVAQTASGSGGAYSFSKFSLSCKRKAGGGGACEMSSTAVEVEMGAGSSHLKNGGVGEVLGVSDKVERVVAIGLPLSALSSVSLKRATGEKVEVQFRMVDTGLTPPVEVVSAESGAAPPSSSSASRGNGPVSVEVKTPPLLIGEHDWVLVFE